MRSLPILACAWALAACGAKNVAESEDTPADPPTHRAAPGESLQTESGLWRLSTSEAFVGVIARNVPASVTHPSDYCLDDGQHYTGAPVRVGDLNVFGDADRIAGDEHGVVVVYGERRASLLEALTPTGPCPDDFGREEEMAQMRSDWVAAEGGARTTRERVAAQPYIRATSIHAVSVHRVIDDGAEGGAVVVELTNPFDIALDGITAQAHYEGGPGKPMPKMLPIILSLAPGETQRVELAPSIEGGPAGADTGEPRGTYWLLGLDLSGDVGRAQIDVTIVVSSGKRPRKHP